MKAVKGDSSKEAFQKAPKAVRQTSSPAKKTKEWDCSRPTSPSGSDSEDEVVLVEKAKAQGAKEAELSIK
eukprot:gene2083-2780_t